MVGPLRAALWTFDTGGGSVSPAPDRTRGETAPVSHAARKCSLRCSSSDDSQLRHGIFDDHTGLQDRRRVVDRLSAS